MVTSGAQAQTPTALPPLPGDNQSHAAWINDWGEVAGNSTLAFAGGSPLPNTTTAVVWDRNGTIIRVLPPLEGDTETAVFGNAINNKGQVAGESIGSDGTSTAVVWHRNGTIMMVLPPLPGDTDSRAFAISAHGQVVGKSFRFDNISFDTTVVWDQKGTPRVLSSGSGPSSSGLSINPRTEVAGNIRSSTDNFTGVVWDRKGARRALPPLDGDFSSSGHSINARGHVAGTS